MSKYGTEHARNRAALKPIVDSGRAICAEPRCVIEERGGSRLIHPGTRWHVSHDPTGTITIGPSHHQCNEAENARRNNPRRAQGRRRVVL